MIYKKRLLKSEWFTDDTCPSCLYQGMRFKADRIEDDGVFAGYRAWRIDGILYCQKCGYFDDMVMLYDYQVPNDCIESIPATVVQRDK